ncbi:hypothetical protein HYV58_00260, partial [Candidatus Peregrinibacteria bacterium]|nr:hypothetical protein [Candidatus Peregrinibacteria bacterium]
HVAFTKSPNYHAYYLDGVLIGSKDVSPSSSYASDYGGPAKTPHNDIIIGDTAVDTDIEDLKIWNRSLTDNEVRQEGGFPPPVPPAAPSGPAANAIGTSTDSTIGATAWTMTGTTTATSTTIPSQNTQPPSEQQPAMPLPPQVSAPAEPPLQMCGQAITRAYRPSSGECRDFPNTCIPAGWIAQPCEIKVTPLAPLAPPPPAFSARQCKQHLASVRGGLIADRQFWKDVNNQLKNASKDYADRASVSELLKEAKELIAALDKMAKRGVCTPDLLEELDDHQQRLQSEVFAELSVYLSEMQEEAGLPTKQAM